MPIQPIHVLSEEVSLSELNEVVAKLQKALNYLLAGNLDFDNIRARGIKAENIEAGTITANEIAANTITADKMDVNQLSAISANLGTITAGLLQAVTIIGSLIQSAVAGVYPRAEMSNTAHSFKVEGGPGSSIEILAGLPNLLYFFDPTQHTFLRQISGVFTAQATGRIDLVAPTGGVYINGTNVLAAIASKANTFTGVTGGFAFLDPSNTPRFANFINGVYQGLS